MANVVEVAIRGIDEATRVFESVGSTAQKSMDDAESSVRAVDESIQDVSSLDVDTGGTEEAMQSASDSVHGVDQAIQETEETGQNFGSKMKGVFESVADKWKEITVIAGTAGAGMEGFARSQGDVNATLERTSIATGESTEALRGSADAMSDHTFATSDAIAGMEMLVQRGIDTQDQFESILPHVDGLAAATGKDFPDALESADRILKPFGQDLNDLGENTDQMTRIMAQTDIPLGTLERNLGRIPDQLDAMGFGLDDAAAGIEVFRDKGYSGQESVREFRRAVEESEGDMDAFLESLGLTNKEWDKYQDQVEPAVGLTDELADANNDQMTVMEKLQGSVTNLMTEYGAFADLAGMLAPILISLGPLMKGVAMATQLFNVALLANPIGLVIGAIVALIAIVALLWANWDEVSAFLVETWEWIKEMAVELFGGLGEYLSTFWDWIKEITMIVWNSIVEFFSKIWDSIKDLFMQRIELLQTILSVAWEFISETISNNWNAIKDFLTTIWESIKIVFTTAVDTIKGFLDSAWNFIKDTVTTVFNGIKDFFTMIWNAYITIIKTQINIIQTVITTIFNAIKNVITTIWNAIKTATSTVWNGIVNLVQGIINAFKNRIQANFNTIKGVITSVWNTIKNVSSSVWNGIKSTISGIVSGISSTVSSVFNGIASTIAGVWNGVSSSTSSIWNGIVSSIKGAINGVIGAINGMLNAIGNIKISLPTIPDWVPGMGGKGGGSIGFPSVPNIPMLAKGGKAVSETLAIIGEGADEEAVIPLNNQVMADLGRRIGAHMEGGGNNSFESSSDNEVNVNVSIDYKEMAKHIADAIVKKLVPEINKISLGDVRLIVQNMNMSGDYDLVKLSRELNKLISRSRTSKGHGYEVK